MICRALCRVILKFRAMFDVAELSSGFGDIFVIRPDSNGPTLVS